MRRIAAIHGSSRPPNSRGRMGRRERLLQDRRLSSLLTVSSFGRSFPTLLLTAFMAVWVSGLAPLGLEMLAGSADSGDCCPDDNADDDELPCSPFCTSCLCSFGARYVPKTDGGPEVSGPRPTLLTLSAPVWDTDTAPTSSFIDEILRPPRA